MSSSPLFTGESCKPPADDEIEVSLFGPGVGECIVVHLGRGEWIVVDSCCPVGVTDPVGLLYLQSLGVVAGSAVRLLVATHWHSDHIRGMAKLLEACEQATFVCSAALESRTFVELITALDQRPMMQSSGADEFHRIFAVLKARAASGRTVTPTWAAVDRILYEDLPRNIEVRSLSPSDAAQTLALREISTLMPHPGSPKRRLVARTPNENSVVLSVRVSDRCVLLGADLETSTNPAVGWTAIVDAHSRAAARAEIFKIPHHGSSNADDPRVWKNLVDRNPVAALSQFASGTKPLPSVEDVRRLLVRTQRLYCTGPPTGWRPKVRDHTVEKTLRQVTRNHRAINGAMGHVRLRAPLTGAGKIAVHLGNGAFDLAA
jgi:Metallo-beta-lactamase superfamily